MESKGAISSTFPEKVRMDGQIFSEFALTSDLLISVHSGLQLNLILCLFLQTFNAISESQ